MGIIGKHIDSERLSKLYKFTLRRRGKGGLLTQVSRSAELPLCQGARRKLTGIRYRVWKRTG